MKVNHEFPRADSPEYAEAFSLDAAKSWDNKAYFVDLSSNNAVPGAPGDGFDAAVYEKAGHRLVAIKVSQGAKYVDPYWRPWAEAAHKAGLGVVLYHFADGSASATSQAAHFAEQIKNTIYRAVCVDIEQLSEITSPVPFRETFEEELQKDGHSNLIVYSDAGYFEQYGVGLKPSGGRVWVAAVPSLPAGWWGASPWAHQYSFTQHVKGVSKPCDISKLL